MFNPTHAPLLRIVFFQLPFLIAIVLSFLPAKSFARSKAIRSRVNGHVIDDQNPSSWMPKVRTIRGIPQPAQFGWEPHQECRHSGLDPSVNDFYNSVNHLTCAQARSVVRRTIYGNNEKFGKFYRCDGRDVPAIAVILTSNEDLDQGVAPDYSCADHYTLYRVYLRTLSGPCAVGWDCNANAGGV